MGSEWKEVSLGDASISIQTGPFGSQLHKSDYVTEGIPSIMPVNISDNRITTDGIARITEADAQRLSKYLVITGDIVYSRRGDVERRALVRERENGWLCGTGCLRVRFDHNLVDSEYASFQLGSPFAREWIVRHAVGATMPNLNTSILSALPFILPPLPEQKAIAHILGSLDDKIELNRRMNATLEGMAQALFQSWFVDFDPVLDNALAAGNPIPDELADRAAVRRQALANGTANREAAQPFPAAFQFTEEQGWIPKGWEAIPLNQAIKINPPVKLPKDTVALYADMKALPTEGFSIKGVIEKAYKGGTKFQNDDVLLARITPCLENGKTGIVDFLSSPTEVGFGSTEFIVMRGKGELKLPFVACLAREENFRLHCIQSMVGSSGRQRVQNACFDSFHIARPSDLPVLKLFSEMTLPMFQRAREQARESQTLTNIRDSLLPKLISGELRIGDAEILAEDALV